MLIARGPLTVGEISALRAVPRYPVGRAGSIEGGEQGKYAMSCDAEIFRRAGQHVAAQPCFHFAEALEAKTPEQLPELEPVIKGKYARSPEATHRPSM